MSYLTVLHKTQEESLLLTQSANGWVMQAKKKPIPKCLFDDFWYEGELCILFADTNVGKSILAVQIADSITQGNPIPPFKLSAPKQKVLYLDFELSEKQFENRYSNNYTNHYTFSPDFLRSELIINQSTPTNYQDFELYLQHCLEEEIKRTQTKIVLIDNITYLGVETEKSRYALPLMKSLKKLQHRYNLSLLVLAHTPKRDNSLPITRNDLQGSKMLINFCDSAFTIGESYQDKHLRYLKHLKSRNTVIVYDSSQVCLCQVEKKDNFLGFSYLGLVAESNHLRPLSKAERIARQTAIKKLKETGFSNVHIGKQLGVSEGTIRKLLK